MKLLASLLALAAVSASAADLTLQVSSETAPAGGFAQFRISPTVPALISAGGITMDFDPSVFGNVVSASVLSAKGDPIGTGIVLNLQAEATFTSASASLGQLPGIPVMVVTVPVLATAKVGATSTVTITAGTWLDQLGNTLNVTVSPGTFTVGGHVSIQSVTPNSGLLPAGTVLSVTGTGFDSSTTVAIDGASVASTQFVSATQLNVTLGGATEMTGKHVRVGSVEFVSASPAQGGAPSGSSYVLILPTLPAPRSGPVGWDYPISTGFVQYYSVLQNPSSTPVTATYYFENSGSKVTAYPIVIPPYGIYIANNSMFANDLGTIFMTTPAPLRMAEFRSAFSGVNTTTLSLYPPTALTDFSRLRDGASLSVSLNYQIGSQAPKPIPSYVSGPYPYTISISPEAQPWLTISPQRGTPQSTVTTTIDPTRLGQGTYQGTVTLTTILPPDLAQNASGVASYPVSINVNAQPTISGDGVTSFSVLANGISTLSSTIAVTTNGTSTSVTASIIANTGGNWLSVTGGGATPATLTLTANPTGLSPGIYYSSVHIQGPLNAVDIPAEIEIVAPGPPALTMSPPSIALVLEAGQSGARKPGILTNTIPMTTNFTAVASDPWINFYVFAFGIVVSGDATNLKAGTYTGSITVTPATGAPAVVPVTLTVLAVPQITVSPTRLTMTTAVGSTTSGNLTLASPTGQALINVTTIPSTSPALGLSFQYTPSYPNMVGQSFAPTTIQITASAATPGSYQSGVTISWTGGSVTIPITVYVTASANAPPLMTAVVASGSALAGAISPGELISIYGQGVGGVPTDLQLDSTGKVATTLAGTQVTINGVAAPVVYTSIDQVNAIVPYEASGIANVQVTYAGTASQPWAIPVAPSAPSVFTIGSTGVGAGAIVNSDGSVNSPSNPASRGSAIQIYATGGGQTSPASSTGAVATGAAGLTLPYSVSIGGANTQVLYAGSAPGEVEGVVQMNVVVPSSVTGVSLLVVVTVGGITSQSVTMAVN